ncbi:MAG: hypothetical protein HC831_01945 [Chloroflexia bacterium]|nr:hypothetical protein [Chloroflexia bacterium]
MSKTYLIIGASTGIGLALSNQLKAEGNHVITASRNGDLKFDALTDAFDGSGLPEQLDGVAYCPGSINLKPFHRLTIQDFSDDFNINVLGAVKIIQAVANSWFLLSRIFLLYPHSKPNRKRPMYQKLA